MTGRLLNAAIITAAGSSARMAGQKKEYLPMPFISDETRRLSVLGASVSAFASSPQIGLIVITLPPGEESIAKSCLPAELFEREGFIHFVSGGPTRRISVFNALSFLESYNPAFVLIHDGARPWINVSLIEKIIEAVIGNGAVIPVLPLAETPKEIAGCGKFITQHLKRRALYSAQTPQGFKFPEILSAHKKAREKETAGFEYTDDAEVWGEFIGQVAVIPGDPKNRKITYLEDL